MAARKRELRRQFRACLEEGMQLPCSTLEASQEGRCQGKSIDRGCRPHMAAIGHGYLYVLIGCIACRIARAP